MHLPPQMQGGKLPVISEVSFADRGAVLSLAALSSCSGTSPQSAPRLREAVK